MTTSQKDASPSASRKRALSPGRPRAATIQARQDRLMDIVTAEFLTYGYEGANIARVARTAGVSPKTIYARYATKDELLLAVVVHLTEASREGLAQELTDGSISPEQGLTTFALTTAYHWTSEREFGLYRLVITEAGRFPHLVTLYRESTDAFREVVTTYLTDQIARRVLVIKDVGTAVQLFVSVTTGQIRERMLLGERPSSIEIEAQVKEGVRMFLAWCKSK